MALSSISKTRTIVVFNVIGQTCALELKELQEITSLAELSCPPGLPSILKGFLNLSGKAIPVLNLARLFHLNEGVPGLYSHLLILKAEPRSEERRVGKEC